MVDKYDKQRPVGQKMKKIVLASSFTLMIVFLSTNALAIIAGPDVFGLDFRFNNPGARANAMGGAFIALADDATAAYANPAGLTILTEPEISIEYRGGQYTTRITDSRGITDTDASASSASFLSYAKPMKDWILYRLTGEALDKLAAEQ